MINSYLQRFTIAVYIIQNMVKAVSDIATSVQKGLGDTLSNSSHELLLGGKSIRIKHADPCRVGGALVLKNVLEHHYEHCPYWLWPL